MNVSSIAAASGGFVTTLSDGTVTGLGPAFDPLRLTHVERADVGEWLGARPATDQQSAALLKLNLTGRALWQHTTEWSQTSGLGGPNAASPTCEDPELNTLMAEYRAPTRFRPTCGQFTRNGPGSQYLPWAQLSGYELFYRGRRDNPYSWAMVKETLLGTSPCPCCFELPPVPTTTSIRKEAQRPLWRRC